MDARLANYVGPGRKLKNRLWQLLQYRIRTFSFSQLLYNIFEILMILGTDHSNVKIEFVKLKNGLILTNRFNCF
jgi:hypothetical protein